ncbi:MAG: alkaline phosphatase family protein [Terriglobia bacterium]
MKVAGLLLLTCLLVGRTAIAAPEPLQHHVLVISVDGMGAHFYMSPPSGIRIPNLLRLKRQGSYAEAVEGVYPTVTYPSHTTIVTGRLPAEHGIYTNLSSRVAGKNPFAWFWFAKSIRSTTIWDEARRHGLTTATMGWPVTAGADVDWDVPEIWKPAKVIVPDPLYVAKFMNPQFALELLSALGPPRPNADNDVLRTRATVFTLEKHKPDLMLVHLIDLDATEHHHGPLSPEAAATLGRADREIGDILAAAREAGLGAETDVFIVSDHGFLPVQRVISPNTLLVKAGLLTADASGNITGGKIDTVSNGGSFFIYWPKTEDLRTAVDRALEPLLDRRLVWAVLGPQALRDLGADPQAELALDAPKGAMFGSSGRGALVSTQPTGGTHGYLPFRAGLEASFIAWGPGIRQGVDLHRIRMTSVGPTILRALGITDPTFGDSPPLKDIWKVPSD